MVWNGDSVSTNRTHPDRHFSVQATSVNLANFLADKPPT